MIALAGYYRYMNGNSATLDIAPVARLEELRTDRRTDSGTITEIQTVPTLHTIFLRAPGIQNLQKLHSPAQSRLSGKPETDRNIRSRRNLRKSRIDKRYDTIGGHDVRRERKI